MAVVEFSLVVEVKKKEIVSQRIWRAKQLDS